MQLRFALGEAVVCSHGLADVGNIVAGMNEDVTNERIVDLATADGEQVFCRQIDVLQAQVVVQDQDGCCQCVEQASV